jgi:hypothetical protein
LVASTNATQVSSRMTIHAVNRNSKITSDAKQLSVAGPIATPFLGVMNTLEKFGLREFAASQRSSSF